MTGIKNSLQNSNSSNSDLQSFINLYPAPVSKRNTQEPGKSEQINLDLKSKQSKNTKADPKDRNGQAYTNIRVEDSILEFDDSVIGSDKSLAENIDAFINEKIA